METGAEGGMNMLRICITILVESLSLDTKRNVSSKHILSMLYHMYISPAQPPRFYDDDTTIVVNWDGA